MNRIIWGEKKTPASGNINVLNSIMKDINMVLIFHSKWTSVPHNDSINKFIYFWRIILPVCLLINDW